MLPNTASSQRKINQNQSTKEIVMDKPMKKKRRKERPRIKKQKAHNQSINLEPVLSEVKCMQTIIPDFEVDNMDNMTIELFSCSIKAVLSHSNGQFIRKRNTKSKKIKLKTFRVNSSSCIFITVRNNDLTLDFNKLSIGDNRKMKRKQSDKTNVNHVQGRKAPNKSKKQEEMKAPENFATHYTLEQVLAGIEKGELIRGAIRINQKNAQESYVSNINPKFNDYFINSVVDRNRALDGDEVVIKLKPKDDCKDDRILAEVVYIEKEVHPRITIGYLKLPQRKNETKRTHEFALFYSRDKRIPCIRISTQQCSKEFRKNPSKFEKHLYFVKIIKWPTPRYAQGELIECLGLEGDLRVEEMAILKEYSLDITPFDSKFVRELNLPDNNIPVDLQNRQDFRKECIFTIDPLTARDLDDAVSAKKLPNGNYEIGVHISDVTFYLKDSCELDAIVAKKATTIYLVNNVYHMLPKELCMYCSLLPGKDKLVFSVLWEITPLGEVVKKSFCRGVINSCTQLAYEHAQIMIENPDKSFAEDELPKIYNGFTYKDLSEKVNILHRLALILKDKRIKNGSLRIDQVKLSFSLDPKSGEPTAFYVHESKAAHSLIEEFALLANISVAEEINNVYPDLAFLRCHEPPKHTMMIKLQSNLEIYGIHVDISTAGSINSSLRQYITDDEAGRCRSAVLNHLFAKPMTRARYFCASNEDEETFCHFALSVPLYTHFTSPIRRYADIMVHRLLAASLGYQDKPNWTEDHVASIAANCNGQKYNAKRAGEASSDLYLAHYIEQHQPFIEDAVVVDVKNKSFDAIILKTGSIVRLYNNKMPDGVTWRSELLSDGKSELVSDDKSKNACEMYKVTLSFPKTKYPPIDLIIEMFTHIKVNLTRKKNSYKLEASLLRPV